MRGSSPAALPRPAAGQGALGAPRGRCFAQGPLSPPGPAGEGSGTPPGPGSSSPGVPDPREPGALLGCGAGGSPGTLRGVCRERTRLCREAKSPGSGSAGPARAQIGVFTPPSGRCQLRAQLQTPECCLGMERDRAECGRWSRAGPGVSQLRARIPLLLLPGTTRAVRESRALSLG